MKDPFGWRRRARCCTLRYFPSFRLAREESGLPGINEREGGSAALPDCLSLQSSVKISTGLRFAPFVDHVDDHGDDQDQAGDQVLPVDVHP